MNAYSDSSCNYHQNTPGLPGVSVSNLAEEWRAIPADIAYEVSSRGRIRNARTGKLLSPWFAGAGYLYVHLWRSRIKMGVHRLVALTFLGDPPTPRHEVAHNDGNRENNCVANLRWATHAENQADIRRHGTGYYHGWHGENHPTAKLNDQQVVEIRRSCREGLATRKSLAVKFGVSRASIDHIVQGRTWKHLL